MEKKDYLYHYTNVDSLALILKNKTIRLNPLTKMDDLQEELSQDEQNYGQYCFVSSWTSESKEIIPMWRMYCHQHHGVRIKLIKNPFKIYKYPQDEFKKRIGLDDNIIINDGSDIELLFSISQLLKMGVAPSPWDVRSILQNVQYTEDNSLLNPKVLTEGDKKIHINLSKLAIYKNEYWGFQKEIRYLLRFFPVSLNDLFSRSDGMFKLVWKKMVRGEPLPISHCDLTIDESAFRDFEIMLAPDISSGDEVIIETLVKEFNPTVNIIRSSLSGLIR